MVIWGDGDTVLPFSHATAAVESMPDARLVTWPGSGISCTPNGRPNSAARSSISSKTTAPSSYDPQQWRALLRRGRPDARPVPDEIEPAAVGGRLA